MSGVPPGAAAFGAGPSGPARLAPDSAADGQWHRLHPLTPLFRGGLVLLVVFGYLVSSLRERITEWMIGMFAPRGMRRPDGGPSDPLGWLLSDGRIWLAVLAVLVVLLVLMAVFWLVWRFQEFRITSEHVEVRKGIIARSHRRAPLDRVQGVNLIRPFPARLFGLAKLDVVGAGSNLALEYLATSRAEAVRADILRLASGVRDAEARAAGESEAASPAQPEGGVDAGRRSLSAATGQLAAEMSGAVGGMIDGVDLADVAPHTVVHLPWGRIIAAHALALVERLGIFLVAWAVVLVVVGLQLLVRRVPDAGMIVFGLALVGAVPTVFGSVAVAWSQLAKALRYSIAPTSDGVRITFGLLTTVTETIPPGRIFAVEVSQPLLWRPFGWWRVRVNRMTGRGSAGRRSDNGQPFTTVLPVGTRADVERVLALLLPGIPASEQPLLWEHGILGRGADAADPYLTMARRARWVRPLSGRRHGLALTDHSLLARRGRIWRSLTVFPLARLQGFAATQGPVARAQRVAAVRPRTIAGPVHVRIVGLERDVVTTMLLRLPAAAAAAAETDRSHRWAAVESIDPSGTLPPSTEHEQGRRT